MRPVAEFYSRVPETGRLRNKFGALEFARTQEILLRYLPSEPATILDVGGGDGIYAEWLASLGYRMHHLDLTPEHVRRALSRDGIATAHVGDATRLALLDAVADVVLLLGPLYHLCERTERVAALAEARRALVAGGVVFAACINRYAPVLAGMVDGRFDDPDFVRIMQRSSGTGQHRNHTSDPSFFTDAYFHARGELAGEAAEAGFDVMADLPVEGVGWLAADFDQQWADPAKREALLEWIRDTEIHADLLPVSAHGIVVARRS